MLPMKDNPVIRFSRIPGRTPLLRRSTAWLTTLAAAWGLAAPAVGQCEYEVTILPNVPCFGADAVPKPKAINDNGEMVGSFVQCASSSEAAFHWSKETGLVILNMPEGTTNSDANDINNNGQIVGEYSNTDCQQGFMGFLLDGEEFTCLGTLPGGTNSVANAINDNGVITGWWGNTVTGPSPLAFVWEDGVMTDISGDLETNQNAGRDMSIEGVVAGTRSTGGDLESHAFVWANGNSTTLPIPAGATESAARAINDLNQVTGVISSPDAKAIAWTLPDQMTVPAVDPTDQSVGRDINNFGQMVGLLILTDENEQYGFVWNGNGIVKLNDHLASEKQIWIGDAYAINNSGQIAATGIVGEPFSGDGHAFLLTPVDQPPTDLSGDCTTGVEDLLIMLGEWQDAESIADINNDGVVNVSDLLLLLSGWGS